MIQIRICNNQQKTDVNKNVQYAQKHYVQLVQKDGFKLTFSANLFVEMVQLHQIHQNNVMMEINFKTMDVIIVKFNVVQIANIVIITQSQAVKYVSNIILLIILTYAFQFVGMDIQYKIMKNVMMVMMFNLMAVINVKLNVKKIVKNVNMEYAQINVIMDIIQLMISVKICVEMELSRKKKNVMMETMLNLIVALNAQLNAKNIAKNVIMENVQILMINGIIQSMVNITVLVEKECGDENYIENDGCNNCKKDDQKTVRIATLEHANLVQKIIFQLKIIVSFVEMVELISMNNAMMLILNPMMDVLVNVRLMRVFSTQIQLVFAVKYLNLYQSILDKNLIRKMQNQPFQKKSNQNPNQIFSIHSILSIIIRKFQ